MFSFHNLFTSLLSLLASMFLVSCSNDSIDTNPKVPEISDQDIIQALDVQLQGWNRGIIYIANEQQLNQLFGKSAELYMSYGFRKLYTRRYDNKDRLTITVQIFLVDRAENAYGLYSFDTTGKKLPIGQGASYSNGVLKFWKGQAFVRIFASEEANKIERYVLKLGQEIDYGLAFTSDPPLMVSFVPTERILPDSLCFFHTNSCFNNIYYLPESIHLKLSEATDVVSAQYNFVRGTFPRLFLIKYPDNELASLAFEHFGNAYFHGQYKVYEDGRNIVIRNEEDSFDSMTIHDKFLILVFESSFEVCRRLTNEVLSRMGVKATSEEGSQG